MFPMLSNMEKPASRKRRSTWRYSCLGKSILYIDTSRCWLPCCAKGHTVQFSLAQDGIYALGKAHMRSTPSLWSFLNVAYETAPMVIWLTMALSRPFREDRLALPLSTPLSSRRSVVWCPLLWDTLVCMLQRSSSSLYVAEYGQSNLQKTRTVTLPPFTVTASQISGLKIAHTQACKWYIYVLV